MEPVVVPDVAPAAVAAFDVDHTLTVKDCVVPFLREVAGWRWYANLLLRIVPLGVAVARRDRDSVKAVVTAAAVKGRTIGSVDEKATRFARRAFPTWLRDDTVRRLEWHRAQGHRIVLVSASYRSYLEHLARLLGCDAVLSTEIEVDEAGRCTGRLKGANCRGVEKATRLSAWMRSQGFDGVNVWAYGDSTGDDQMLSMAHHAVRVTKVPIPYSPVDEAA